MQEELEALDMLGIRLPSPAYIVGVILFSVVGMIAYFVGRRRRQPATKWLGLALMLYPYVVWVTWGVYVVGVALTIAAWVVSERESGSARR